MVQLPMAAIKGTDLIEHQEHFRPSDLRLFLSQIHRDGQNTTAAMQNVINKIETTIWSKPKFVAS
jgi:hypothetical protein